MKIKDKEKAAGIFSSEMLQKAAWCS